MLQQIMQGQAAGVMEAAKKMADLNSKIDKKFVEMGSGMESLNKRVQYIEGTTASTSTTPGYIPGKQIHSSKEYAHAISLRNGRELLPRGEPNPNTKDSVVPEGEDFYQDDVLADKTIEKPTQPQVPPATPSVEKTVAAKTKDAVFVPPPYKTTASIPWTSLAYILHSRVISGVLELLVLRKRENRTESHTSTKHTRSPVAEREAVRSAVHPDTSTRSQRRPGSPFCQIYSTAEERRQSILQFYSIAEATRQSTLPVHQLYSIAEEKNQYILAVDTLTRSQRPRSSPDHSVNQSTRPPPRPSNQSALNQTT
ncbi:hypothetical protein ISN45_At05g028650 [Arabidopsis thaliana x Arabidopsis arenosa]|uniref:Uncharacterized protein n=1 Tax=Arabidopsis thaliana x Arabidopsis arenosa TaxID=1240361 RepID=A0A8T2D9X9_9BRAS|nr:hypothetical protein ISN45_At05g028650 [Arabidopsis thaliana x Arabidopsis arenosa]